MHPLSRLTNPKTLNLIKYCLILGAALVLSVIAYSVTPLVWLRNQVFQTVALLIQQWMQYYHSVLFFGAYTTFWGLVVIGWLLAPFVLVVMAFLNLFKPQWLPQMDEALLKPLNVWMDYVLLFAGMTGLCLGVAESLLSTTEAWQFLNTY